MEDEPKTRRSIQDIVPPARSKPIRASRSFEKPAEEVTPGAPASKPTMSKETPPTKKGRRKNGNVVGLVGVALVVILVVGGAFAAVSTVFYRATINLDIHTFSVSVAETFETSPDGVLLPYVETVFERVATKAVPKTGSEFVEDRASGKVVVFNEYSTQSQRLITNTRFETPEGLVYRVKSPVVVPGYKTEAGKVTPGSIEVTVYADDAGEKYNIGAASFSIPGLKGSPQFEKMYARSTESMSGGFVGEKAVVDASVRDAAVAELKTQLQQELPADFASSLSAETIYFDETLVISFSEQPDKATSDGATVSVKGIAKAPTFPNEKLARVIATEGGVTYENTLRIVNVDDLALSLVSEEDSETLQLTISGEAQLEGVYNVERLVQDLAGKDRKSVGVVLSGYPAIQDMRISIYPFWRNTIPENTDRIEIHIEGENAPE